MVPDGGERDVVKPFLQFVVTACIGLLSWWQLELYIGMSVVTALMLIAGLLAAALSWRSTRLGYGLATVVGLAYLAEIVWLTPPSSLEYMQPLLAWAFGLVSCGAVLLWTTRERGPAQQTYERHAEF
ncbi:MAG: hypothetical protein H6509_03745 [Bryobacterales bacterium]|nr:hypothetical protein [Bryobacterales bacterium]